MSDKTGEVRSDCLVSCSPRICVDRTRKRYKTSVSMSGPKRDSNRFVPITTQVRYDGMRVASSELGGTCVFFWLQNSSLLASLKHMQHS